MVSDPGHYFADRPEVGTDPRTVRLTLPDVSLDLVSDRGVFSHGRLDAGTRLLLLEAPPAAPSDRVVVDVGCGWGPITCVTARRSPHVRVWAVDVNERARRLTAANAHRLGLTNVTVVAPDEVPDDLRVDRILSNPPIRVGKARLHELCRTWLDRLTPTGRAHLVVNRHLGADSLARHLTDGGWSVRRLVSRRGYRLLEIGHPDEPTDARGRG